MGWSFYGGMGVRPVRVGFSEADAGPGGVKSGGGSIGMREPFPHGGKLVAGGCGLLSFLIFGVLSILCFAVFSRLEPPPVAKAPPVEPPAGGQQQAEPETVQPAAVEPEPRPPELAIEPPTLPNTEPRAEPPALPEFKIEPEPAYGAEFEAEPEPSVEPRPVYRNWRSKTGEFRVEAEFVSMAMGRVRLRKADGEEVTLGLEQLSAADQEWIEKERTSSSSVRVQLSRGSRILSGTVVDVADGDTITVSDRRNEEHLVRLQGIDAPEEGQAYSSPAKEALSDRILGKSVRVAWQRKDEDGRILGHVFLGMRWINKELVEDGWAWYRGQTLDEEELAGAEERASEKRLGLWAAPNAVPPWEFGESEPAKEEPVKEAPANEESPSGEYWLTTSSGVRHNGSCRYFGKSKGKPCGPDAGTACKVCGG